MHAVSDHMDWPISNHVELWARLRMLAYPVRAPIFYASHASASSALPFDASVFHIFV